MEPTALIRLRQQRLISVIRAASAAAARSAALAVAEGGIRLLEITFTVPEAPALVARLLAERPPGARYALGMGTVTTAERARAAVACGAEFLVTPNVSEEVAEIARANDLYLVMGALTPTELVRAHRLGADLLKVYPLPPVGGPAYLSVVRQPLGDLGPMLAGGGYGLEEIPAYRAAGAVAFGIGAPLLGADEAATRARVARALALARGATDAPAAPEAGA